MRNGMNNEIAQHQHELIGGTLSVRIKRARTQYRRAHPLNIAAAAEYAGVSRQDVYAAMRSGALMWKRLGRERITARTWIEDWING